MKGYVSKWDKAHRIAKAGGYKKTDFGYINVVKQIFAKLVVGWNSTICRQFGGKLIVIKH